VFNLSFDKKIKEEIATSGVSRLPRNDEYFYYQWVTIKKREPSLRGALATWQSHL
jgi:hypothetical protein